MPIYEYRCTECGHEMETLQAMSARPLRKCPECKGKLQRVQSAPAFQFKGSGWYVTDYAGKGADKKAESAPEAEKSGKEDGAKKEPKKKESGSKKKAEAAN